MIKLSIENALSRLRFRIRRIETCDLASKLRDSSDIDRQRGWLIHKRPARDLRQDIPGRFPFRYYTTSLGTPGFRHML